MSHRRLNLSMLVILLLTLAAPADARQGYYRQPDLHRNTLVFVAEGDLWLCDLKDEIARRLTSDHGDESHPAIAPDGAMIAFCAQYTGQSEVYVMPTAGGVPRRLTYGSRRAEVCGWTRDGRVVVASQHRSTLPDAQVMLIDPDTCAEELVPLSQASFGEYSDDGMLYFVRYPFQGSLTKRYKGGQVQRIWKFAAGMEEAVPLTADYNGTSRNPMWHDGRVYFATDRDGTMNIWSMDADGGDLRQHSFHTGWDVKDPALHDGRIVYQLGADLYMLDLETEEIERLRIELPSDFDQMRSRWIDDPADFLTHASVSADGGRVALTARGEVFTVPRKGGRLVHVTRDPSVRYRQATFAAKDDHLIAMADATGELELWSIDPLGLEVPAQLTRDGAAFRFDHLPSPCGRWIAYKNKDFQLVVWDVDARLRRVVDESPHDNIIDLAWSDDGRYLAYARYNENKFSIVRVLDTDDWTTFDVTSDRVNSYSPAWAPDGAWLYFLSDRNIQTVVAAPWGQYQPEPFLDRRTQIFALPVEEPVRSPFVLDDELVIAANKAAAEAETEAAESTDAGADEAIAQDDAQDVAQADASEDAQPPAIEFNRDAIAARIIPVPVSPGNYAALSVTEDALIWLSFDSVPGSQPTLQAMKIDKEKHDVTTVAGNVTAYELSHDRSTLLIRQRGTIALVDAAPAPADLAANAVNLNGWRFPVDPAIEWRQMFVDAWRLQRDYFYDRNMHGVDWDRMREKYLPLVDRVTTRGELSDLLGQIMSEISALHTYVFGGDLRDPDESVGAASLGAWLMRDADAGGWRIERIYRTDPTFPDRRGPLQQPDLDVREGDVILKINGAATLSAPHVGELLWGQAGRQVRLQLIRDDASAPHDVIVTPISMPAQRQLRYQDWELSRRDLVDDWSDRQIGYVHLQAMGDEDFAQFAREFYPVHRRPGLIIDVRHNNGGNIDSWILSRLQRQIWMYWQGRAGQPDPNMQYAYNGHIVVICDAHTYSDGEAFTEGFKRLGLGNVIGQRTGGGGIWLSFDTFLIDRGMASAAEWGVYGPDGTWLIEGVGVEPDIAVDNLPHATFNGRDAQLQAAVDHLLREMETNPVQVPPPPPHPNKASPDNMRR
jgi:tricorn protease